MPIRSLLSLCCAALLAGGCPAPSPTPVPTAADAGSDAGEPPPEDGGVPWLSSAFVSPPLGACILASPALVSSQGEPLLLAASGDGALTGVRPANGTIAFQLPLPAQDGQRSDLAATPLVVGSRVVVAWQTYLGGTRMEHRAAVLDLEARALDPAFPQVTLTGSAPALDGGTVPFRADHAYSRSAIAHLPSSTGLGHAYVAMGNLRDLQPWHGWLFELDLDRWRAQGAAISAVLNTTPTNDCGPENGDGARDDRCGGGIWGPAGPKAHPTADGGWELLVPTGNGATDPSTGLFANAVLRTGVGLRFSPGCDEALCHGFDSDTASEACMASCAHAFFPRMLPGSPPLRGEDGACDGLSFFQCYRRLDLDLGADSPAHVELPGGPRAWVLPAKDGALYLFDGEHLGKLYDRAQATPLCGTPTDTCSADWAGTMVTEPAMTTLDGAPVALVPTFMPDRTHGAGVQAWRVAMTDGAPKLTHLWTTPAPGTPEAKAWFRWHPSRIALFTRQGEALAAVVDVPPSGTGAVLLLRVRDGALLARHLLQGNGQRYTVPLLHDGLLWLSSCGADGKGRLEALRLR